MFDSDADSAFGSGDPTPSHKPRYAIEFSEDPFQNEVHRYGDPFDISGTFSGFLQGGLNIKGV